MKNPLNTPDDDRSIGDDVTEKPRFARGAPKVFVAGHVIAGRYEVVRKLGEGGMGVVYQCFDRVGGVEVAVKGLPPEVSRDEDEMEDIRANYQIVSGLHHQNIAGARTLEKDESTGDFYLVMDLAPGMNLKRWMRRSPQTSVETKLSILRQIAAAIDYAHSERVIHRDVKPENVMVDADGRVKVLDFGLAAQIRSSQSRTSDAITSRGGTPGYKSPEQWLGRPQKGPADVYSFGVMAYWMFAGELPFDGDDPVVLGQAVLSAPVPSVPGQPRYVNAALAKALAKEPEDRFASCGEFVDALSGKAGALGSGGSRPAAATKWVLVAALLAALAGGGYFGWMKYDAMVKAREAEEARVAAEKAAEAKKAAEKAAAEEEAKRKAAEEEAKADEAKKAAAKAAADKAAAEEEAKKAAEKAAAEEEAKRKAAEEEAKADEAKKAAAKAAAEKAAADKAAADKAAAEKAAAEEEAKRKAKKAAEEKAAAKAAAEKAAADKAAAEAEAKRNAEAQAAAEKARLEKEAEQRDREFLLRLKREGFILDEAANAIVPGTLRSFTLPLGEKIEMVWCPPGWFMMGSPETEQERKVDERRHAVRISRGFWIGKYEITRGQWDAVMGGDSFFGKKEPKAAVNWEDCRTFLQRLKRATNGTVSARLPTEAEWEYACRAGTSTPFSFGWQLNGVQASCNRAAPYGTTENGPMNLRWRVSDVGSFSRYQNAWGINDMHGNVYEWCEDYYDDYPDVGGIVVDPKVDSAVRRDDAGSGEFVRTARVVRGGAWNYDPNQCRSACRNRSGASSTGGIVDVTGLRICCDDLP